MSKRTIKLLPYAGFEIDGIEGWLDDMALKGYFFTGSVSSFCMFDKETPKKRRYRIDIEYHDKFMPYSAKRELFSEMGWNYAGNMFNNYIVYYTDDESVTEFNTDEFHRKEQIKKIFSRKLSGLIIILVLDLLWIGFPINVSSLNISFLDTSILICFGAVNLLYLSYLAVLFVRLFRIRKRNSLNRTYHDHKRAKALKCYELLSISLMALLVAIMIPLTLNDLSSGDYYSIEDFNKTIPLPLIEELDSNINEYYDTLAENKTANINTHDLVLERDNFSTEQITDLTQYGTYIYPGKPNNNEEAYMYNAVLYEFKSENKAEKEFKRSIPDDSDASVSYIEDTKFDNAVYYTGTEGEGLVLLKEYYLIVATFSNEVLLKDKADIFYEYMTK